MHCICKHMTILVPASSMVTSVPALLIITNTKPSPPHPSPLQGMYPLCHGLLGGAALTVYCAKSGVLVDPGPGGELSLLAVAQGGAGTLVAPVRMGPGNRSVVWRVKWPGGATTEHELGVDLTENELVVSEGGCMRGVHALEMALVVRSCHHHRKQ
jgi:hypothetical protein